MFHYTQMFVISGTDVYTIFPWIQPGSWIKPSLEYWTRVNLPIQIEKFKSFEVPISTLSRFEPGWLWTMKLIKPQGLNRGFTVLLYMKTWTENSKMSLWSAFQYFKVHLIKLHPVTISNPDIAIVQKMHLWNAAYFFVILVQHIQEHPITHNERLSQQNHIWQINKNRGHWLHSYTSYFSLKHYISSTLLHISQLTLKWKPVKYYNMPLRHTKSMIRTYLIIACRLINCCL